MMMAYRMFQKSLYRERGGRQNKFIFVCFILLYCYSKYLAFCWIHLWRHSATELLVLLTVHKSLSSSIFKVRLIDPLYLVQVSRLLERNVIFMMPTPKNRMMW